MFPSNVVPIQGQLVENMTDHQSLPRFLIKNGMHSRPIRKTGLQKFALSLLWKLFPPPDMLVDVKKKMQIWIKNGVQLAWLIHLKKEVAIIYRNNGEITEVKGFDNYLSGENVLPDFQLHLYILR